MAALRTITLAGLLGLVASGCTPPVRQYALKNQKLTCEQANDYVYRTLRSLDFTLTAFEPAASGHPGTVKAVRNQPMGGTQYVTVTVKCGDTVDIDASEDGRLLGQVDFKRSFYMAFTGVVTQAAVSEAEARAEAQRPVQEKKEKGLRVLLEPVAGLGAKLDFDFDLAAAGVLPVRVTINNASLRAYNLEPDDIVLIQSDGGRVRPLSVDDVTQRVVQAERQKQGSAPAAVDPAAVSRKLQERLMQPHVVAANQMVRGYLYFPLGTYKKGRVTLEDQESEEAEGFVVEF